MVFIISSKNEIADLYFIPYRQKSYHFFIFS